MDARNVNSWRTWVCVCLVAGVCVCVSVLLGPSGQATTAKEVAPVPRFIIGCSDPVCVCVGCLGEKKRYTRQTHGVETDRVIPGLNRITKERQMFECRGLKKPNIINLIDAQLQVTISKRPRIVFKPNNADRCPKWLSE